MRGGLSGSDAAHLSDAELTDSLKDLGADAAVEELYRRHRSAVFSCAVVCCRTSHSAEDLTSHVFLKALRAVSSGSGPRAAWRPYLLTILRRTAAEWAGTIRGAEMSPEYVQWLADLPESPGAESGEARMRRLEDSSLVLRAFRALPERRQTLLWHTEVEGESSQFIGCLLGLDESAIASLAAQARDALRETCLGALADHAGTDDECRRYSPMLGAVVRHTGRRRTEDFDLHLSECRHCSAALNDLTNLDENLGSALSAAVLPWANRAYMAARMTAADVTVSNAAKTSEPGCDTPTGSDTRWRSLATVFPLRSGAVVGGIVAALGLATLAVPMWSDGQGGSASSAQAKVVQPPSGRLDAPQATITAKSSAPTSSRAATPHPAKTWRTASAEPSATHREQPGIVTWSGTLRNKGIITQCVESLGAQVVQNACDGSERQTWQAVLLKEKSKNTWLRNSATGQCIDYSASSQRVHDNATNLAVVMGPCRASGEGQLFHFDPFGDGSDGSYLVRAESSDGKPWNAMQLGMLDWAVEDSSLPATNAPVFLTYNYYNSPRLRYLVEGVAGGSEYYSVNSRRATAAGPPP
ncbi:sigma-70 family RNA polymerase sigma factor [Streptomyces sp. NPDC001795]|uniref:sigma-70 family RNA polymerase sigma factor n=1 Tax=Streptomyces sp. NPDC001795 TaxID=3154525 RepID=UPI00332965C9